MPQPEADELARVRARREEIRARHLFKPDARPPTTAAGVHHLALICRDVEETIRFYQGFLGFPLVELVENRDYAGSSHFFFDLGNRTLLGFFDFPGHDHPPFHETVGGVQHLAISVGTAQFATARAKLDAAGVDYLGPDRGANDSLYFRDPSGLGVFEGADLL
jgi:glyoxylase I family protein